MKKLRIAIIDMEWTAWKGSAARNWSLSYENREIVQIAIIKTINLCKIEIYFLKLKKMFYQIIFKY
jgi:hypothetical protein